MKSKSWKILIVDDEAEVCEALKDFFEDQQFIVEVAHDGEDALSKVDEFKPHCILLDIKMPYLNGIEALGMIELKEKDVEVIMVTAVANIKTALHHSPTDCSDLWLKITPAR